MGAAQYGIVIEQGATFSMELTLKNSAGEALNLTGWTFRGQVRKTIAESAVAANFAFALNTPATDGIVKVSISSADTASIVLPDPKSPIKTPIQYCYDIEAVKPDGTVLRLQEGVASISPEVTR